MNDDLISEEALCQKIDKIKVSSAEIVVHGTKEKPYYEIKYFDLSNNETHIGYSSYNLDYVFKWLEECFEIVNGEKRSDRSRNQTVDDLISRKALLEAIDSSFIIPILKINMREEYKAVLRIREIIANMQTGFDKEKVIEELKRLEVNAFGYYNQYDDEQAFGESAVYRAAIEIIEKGGIE